MIRDAGEGLELLWNGQHRTWRHVMEHLVSTHGLRVKQGASINGGDALGGFLFEGGVCLFFPILMEVFRFGWFRSL